MSSATMTKMAILRLYQDPRFHEIGARLALAVHDEIVIEAPQEHTELAVVILEEAMVEAAKEVAPSLPWKVDGEVHDRWMPGN